MSQKLENSAVKTTTKPDRVVFIPSLRYIRQGNTYIPSVDVSPAEAYGLIQYMTTPGNGFVSDAAVEEVEDLATEAQANDLLMMVGDMILFAAAFRIITNKWGHANILRWDNRKTGYIEQRVEVDING